MKKQKDQMIELTPEQESPGLLKPEDLKVYTAAEAADMPLPGHGQNGDTLAENRKLLNEHPQCAVPAKGAIDFAEQTRTANRGKNATRSK